MATIRQVGVGGGVSGSQSDAIDRSLYSLLLSALGGVRRTVYLNFETGSRAPGGYTPADAVALMRSGAIWVDYGQWPWGQVRFVRVGFAEPGGFGAFLTTAGVPLGRASGFAVTSLNPANTLGGVLGGLTAGIVPAYQYRSDAYDFDLHNWTWAVNLGLYPDGSGHYPYGYGLPTTTGPTSGRVRPMPRAPIGFFSGGKPPQSIYVYSAFAIPIGRGWYFNAQPQIDQAEYADFIARTLGARLVLGNTIPHFATQQPSASSGSPTTRGRSVILPAATLRLTTPYTSGADVTLLQLHLQRLGFGSLLGPTGADGVFGPDTRRAVIAFQTANRNRIAPDGKRVVVDGIVGPANWSLLLQGTPTGPAGAAGGGGTSAGPTGGSAGVARGGVKADHHPTSVPKAPVRAEGVWKKGVPYVVLSSGKDEPVSRYVHLSSSEIQSLAANGGVVKPVLGYKVHFPKASAAGGAGYLGDLITSISDATGLPRTDVELLGAAGAVGAILLLAGK